MNQNTSGPQGPSGPQGIIIPLIRKFYPHTIANQILGVQPMSDTAGEVFGRRGWRQRIDRWLERLLWRYWKHMAGTTIVLSWTHMTSSERHINRERLMIYLNENVGKFGRDWFWYRQYAHGTPHAIEELVIKFRWGRAKWATAVLLRWA